MAIDFELTDAQKKLQAIAREFATDCLAPVVSAADQEADTQKAFQRHCQVNRDWCEDARRAKLTE